MNVIEQLSNSIHTHDSLVCVGLDIDKEKMPSFLFESSQQPYLDFTKAIIDETKDLVCAYKLNLAFYESIESDGLTVLKKTIQYIPSDSLIILDGKRNDIGNTAKKYASALFEHFQADAITVNPYLGWDGIEPFVSYADKCSFILCRTSNPSAADFQDLMCDDKPLYIHVAENIKKWNVNKNCGAVVGATYPEELRRIRSILGDDVPLLIPGVGKQGGDVKKTVRYGTNKHGEMAVINSSRGIIYAGSDQDFAEQARIATETLKDHINSFL